jgi:Tol biopolymer transport system component
MKNNKISVTIFLFCLLATILLVATMPKTKANKNILPEPYSSGAIIPVNIAPLTQSMSKEEWHKTLKANQGKAIEIDGKTYHIAEPIDQYIVYRKIFNSEKTATSIEIIERDITNFDEEILFSSKDLDGRCINCHTSKNNNSNNAMIFVRGEGGGNIIIKDNILKNLQAEQPLNYPSFHPNKNVIAFSTNKFHGMFRYVQYGKVVDMAADDPGIIVIYNHATGTVSSTKELSDKDNYDYSSPCWSNNGNFLYFCRSGKLNPEIPEMYKFDLYRIEYDTATNTFGQAECVYEFSKDGLSCAIPKHSPTDNFLVVTALPSGTFPAQNAGDFYIVKPDAKEGKVAEPLANANSPYGEKYHSFSSNGRWLVFSSTRISKMFSATHICHIDSNGNAGIPIAMPQKDAAHYEKNIYSQTNANTSVIKSEKINGEALLKSEKIWIKEI